MAIFTLAICVLLVRPTLQKDEKCNADLNKTTATEKKQQLMVAPTTALTVVYPAPVFRTHKSPPALTIGQRVFLGYLLAGKPKRSYNGPCAALCNFIRTYATRRLLLTVLGVLLSVLALTSSVIMLAFRMAANVTCSTGSRRRHSLHLTGTRRINRNH